MAYTDDLLNDARHLTARGGKHPRQSSLRRAVSTGYYAVFHLLVADFVANYRIPEQRVRLGRMFEHRRMRGAAFKLADKQHPTPIETELERLIERFELPQQERYEADYNVGRIWSRAEVTETLDLADELITIWRRIRKEKLAQHHLVSMFGAKHE